MTLLRGLDFLVLRWFDGCSFQEDRFAPRPRRSRCNLHCSKCTLRFDLHYSRCKLHLDFLHSKCKCTCHVHFLKCRLHLPFALRELDLHQQACEIEDKGRSGAKRTSKFSWQERFALGMEVLFALGMVQIQIPFALGMQIQMQISLRGFFLTSKR